MKKLIVLIMFGILLQGCVASYGGIKYETSNTMILKVKNKPTKQTLNLFISVRDKEHFEKVTENINKLLLNWKN